MLARLSSTAARATARHRRQLAAPIACGSLLVPSSKQRREINTLLAAASTAEVAASVPLVAAPLVGPAAVTFLSVSPALGAQILFLSPMQAMKQFREDGTTGDVSVMPYAAMAANGAAWCTYGALGYDLTIMAPNASGLLFGTYYCHQFYKYRNPEATVVPYFVGGGSFAAFAVGCASTLDVTTAKLLIGYAGCSMTMFMFLGPLAAIKVVLRDRSAKSLPLAFTLAATANCTLWTSYGALVIHDAFVWGPNGIGLGFSFVQLGLIARFGSGEPKATAAAVAAAEDAAQTARELPKADEGERIKGGS